MADAILFGLAQKMIENLASQTFHEIGSFWGVKDELEKIKNTVSTIHAVLQDAAEQPKDVLLLVIVEAIITTDKPILFMLLNPNFGCTK